MLLNPYGGQVGINTTTLVSGNNYATVHIGGSNISNMTTDGGGNMFIGNSFSGGNKQPHDCQLTLGGAHNSSGYNDDGQVKLYITGSNNDGAVVNFPIFCEDENGNINFVARQNGSDFGLGIGHNAPDRLLHLQGSSNAIIRLTDSDTSGEDDSIVGMIEFETLDSNNPGVSANVRAELTDTTNGACALMFSTGTPTTIGTMMEITSSGVAQFKRMVTISGNSGGTSSSRETTQVFYTTIAAGGGTKTLVFSGMVTGWADIDIGGYAAAGQAACHYAVKFGGYMTQTSTWNVAVLANWTRHTTFSATQNAANYALVVTNNATSQTQVFQVCCRSSASGFTCAFS